MKYPSARSYSVPTSTLTKYSLYNPVLAKDFVLDAFECDCDFFLFKLMELIMANIKNIVNSAPGNYVIITESWRQENFVSAVSVIYYLHDREVQPDFLFPWLFQLLEHKSGTVRYAAVRMFINELGPLTVHIRVPEYKSERLKPEQADRILQALFVSLNNMLARLWEPKYKRYKYINSLPANPYKSVQMVMAELEEYCGKDYGK